MKQMVITALLVLNSAFAMAGEEIKVCVKGMVCAFCAQGIEKKFTALPEVEKIHVSLENKWVKLTLKDGKHLSNDRISELLKDSGYETNSCEK